MLRWSTTRTQNTLPSVIKRTAIDPSGHLGSLYNAYRDRIVETLHVNLENLSDQLHQITKCTILKGTQNQNLLELIDIDEQLRLSLLLNLTEKTGLGTIIDHPHLINEYTRIFRYTYIHREEKLPDEIQNLQEWLTTITPETNTTHVITSISWGVDIIMILQLPRDDHMTTMIDLTLEKYRTYLNGERNDFKRTRDDINSVEEILETKIYSNISTLTKMSSLHDLFHTISQFKMNDTNHERLTYTLYPIQSFYSQHPTSNYIYRPFDSKFEQYLFELITSIRILEACFNEDISDLLCGYFTERFSNVYKQWLIIKKEFIYFDKQFEKLIIDIRRGLVRVSVLDKKLENKKQIDFKKRMNDLTENVIDLIAKGHLINDLNHQQIHYYNVIEYGITPNDTEDTIKTKLLIDEINDRVLCSNDFLNKNNPGLLKELRHILIEEYKTNSKLRLIYADFSYCNYQLHNMILLPSTIKDVTLPHTSSMLKSPSRLSSNETINILLLGETGVGKSTFINALVNYLTYKTLDNAQSNKPIVAIPASFVMTAGENFNEYTAKLADVNNSKNEDFEHPGQSITQHCRSYTYNLNDRRKLRIIDTPGFGDIRGSDQDDRNIQHILNYIKKFSHLNAICFLIKPNESRLNLFFQSCLTQLFNLLGPEIQDNILFCFTNTRSTLYSPGNTTSLLKDIRSSFSTIPFKKKNIFCFDNESFRYLIALQNQIPLNNDDKQVYAMSWINSVIESDRLIRYISKKIIACPIPNEDQAIKCTEIKIVHLTHPMIEIMRYILRNIVIRKMNSLKRSIEIENDDYNYTHLPYQPILLEFLKDYKIENVDSFSEKQDNMIDHLSLLCHISAELGHYLIHIAHYRNPDPFLTGLLRLIKEENDICENQNRNYMNLQLVDSLKKLANNYEQRLQFIKLNPNNITLTEINQWIKYISEYPLVSEYVIDSYRTNVTDTNKISSV